MFPLRTPARRVSGGSNSIMITMSLVSSVSMKPRQQASAYKYGLPSTIIIGSLSLMCQACEEAVSVQGFVVAEGCPAGRVSGVTLLTSADGCESCAPGSFSGSSGLSSPWAVLRGTVGPGCQPCPAGEYQEASGQSVSWQRSRREWKL